VSGRKCNLARRSVNRPLAKHKDCRALLERHRPEGFRPNADRLVMPAKPFGSHDSGFKAKALSSHSRRPQTALAGFIRRASSRTSRAVAAGCTAPPLGPNPGRRSFCSHVGPFIPPCRKTRCGPPHGSRRVQTPGAARPATVSARSALSALTSSANPTSHPKTRPEGFCLISQWS
jgi:hypothetical protein